MGFLRRKVRSSAALEGVDARDSGKLLVGSTGEQIEYKSLQCINGEMAD